MVMNEIFKKLARQAEFSENDLHIQGDNFQYFAELIIRECAAEADKQTIFCRGIPWGRWVKEHFGVKE
jgi:hypothetical protein